MPHPVPGRNQRFRAEWLILAAVTLGVAGLLAETLHREHARIQSREGDRLDVQARVVVENLASQLDGAGKAIDGVRIHMQHPSAAADADSLPDKLKLLTGVLPGVSTMLVQDEDGTIVATSRDELLGKNFRQREYFSVPRANGDPKLLFVSPPFKTSLNTYVMVVSRTLQSAAGGFAGVVSATLDPEYFDALMRSVVYAPDMRTALIHGDGRVFLGFPASAGWQDRDSAVLTKEASEHALGLHDGRLVATRRIDRADLHLNRPIFVTTSRELEAIYAPWRSRASQLGVLVFILLIGASVLLVVSQRRRLADINAALAARIERQLAADRVEMALRGA
ncbi:MAG: hypothetical protein ABIO71_05430, partial [Caldimonas sp.]